MSQSRFKLDQPTYSLGMQPARTRHQARETCVYTGQYWSPLGKGLTTHSMTQGLRFSFIIHSLYLKLSW